MATRDGWCSASAPDGEVGLPATSVVATTDTRYMVFQGLPDGSEDSWPCNAEMVKGAWPVRLLARMTQMATGRGEVFLDDGDSKQTASP